MQLAATPTPRQSSADNVEVSRFLGELQRHARKRRLTRAGLAYRSGLSVDTLNSWFSGRRSPHPNTVERVSLALNLDLARIYGPDVRPTTHSPIPWDSHLRAISAAKNIDEKVKANRALALDVYLWFRSRPFPLSLLIECFNPVEAYALKFPFRNARIYTLNIRMGAQAPLSDFERRTLDGHTDTVGGGQISPEWVERVAAYMDRLHLHLQDTDPAPDPDQHDMFLGLAAGLDLGSK